MSFAATAWAWTISVKPATSKLVLLCLADCHNGESGRCYPSIQYISETTELDAKTVRKSLRHLEAGGFLSIEERPGKSAVFHLDIQTPTKNGTPAKNGTGTPNKNGTPPLPKLVPEPRKNQEDNLERRKLNVEFDEFWDLYPRKAGKDGARKKWPKLSDKDRQDIIVLLKKKPYRNRDPQYIPHGSTFLNQRKWEDEFQDQTNNTQREFV